MKNLLLVAIVLAVVGAASMAEAAWVVPPRVVRAYAPIYGPAPVVVARPAPIMVAPAPIVVAPRPIVVAPPPIVYGPPVVVRPRVVVPGQPVRNAIRLSVP